MNQCSFLLDYFGDPLEDITLRRKLKNMIQFSQDIPQESVTERYLSILDNVGFYGDGRKYQSWKRYEQLSELIRQDGHDCATQYILSHQFMKQIDYLISSRALSVEQYAVVQLGAKIVIGIFQNISSILQIDLFSPSNYYLQLCLRISYNTILCAHSVSDKQLHQAINDRRFTKVQCQLLKHVVDRVLEVQIECAVCDDTVLWFRLLRQLLYYLQYQLSTHYMRFHRIDDFLRGIDRHVALATTKQYSTIFSLLHSIYGQLRAQTLEFYRYNANFVSNFLMAVNIYLLNANTAGLDYYNSSGVRDTIQDHIRLISTYQQPGAAHLDIDFVRQFYWDSLYLLNSRNPFCNFQFYYIQQLQLNKVNLMTSIIEDIRHAVRHGQVKKLPKVAFNNTFLLRKDQQQYEFAITSTNPSETCVLYQLTDNERDLKQLVITKFITFDEKYCAVENRELFDGIVGSEKQEFYVLRQHQAIDIQSHQSVRNLQTIVRIVSNEGEIKHGSPFYNINHLVQVQNVLLPNKLAQGSLIGIRLTAPLLSLGDFTKDVYGTLQRTLRYFDPAAQDDGEGALKYDAGARVLSFHDFRFTYSRQLAQAVPQLCGSQLACLLHIFIKDFLVIIGAPGTGKTYTIIQIIRVILMITQSWFRAPQPTRTRFQQDILQQTFKLALKNTFLEVISQQRPKHQILFVSHSNKSVDQLNQSLCGHEFPLSRCFIYRIISDGHCQRFTTQYYIDQIHGELRLDGLDKDSESKLQQVYNALRQMQHPLFSVFQSFKSLERHLLVNSRLLLSTTTIIDKHFQTLIEQSQLSPVIIVEEAARIPQYSISQLLFLKPYKIILLGDFLQLPPLIKERQLENDVNLTISLFERLMGQRNEVILLEEQYRCATHICDLYRNIYQHKLPQSVARPLADSQLVLKRDPGSVYYHFVTGDFRNESNMAEAQYIMILLQTSLLQAFEISQITIISLYKNQCHLIRALASKQQLEGMEICTVDEYQGLENECIIYSLVTSRPSPYANDLRRNIVAFSRARRRLDVVGDISRFDNEVSRRLEQLAKSQDD